METRFVTCPECDGYGARVIGRGHFADGSENNEEISCPECLGEGMVETVVEPLTEADMDHTPIPAQARASVGRAWKTLEAIERMR